MPRFRQELRIRPRKDVLKLTDSVGLHPGMKPGGGAIRGRGRLAIVQGVGYPNPNRSHFRSMAIWQHARLEERQHDSIGWLGAGDRFDPGRRTHRSPDATSIGGEAIPVALRGSPLLT